jgi:hypothetical protein
MNRNRLSTRAGGADRGAILPMVLVVSVVLSVVVIGIARYSTATLTYGQEVEYSADRLAAANGAMDNALEAIDRGASLCTLSGLSSQAGGLTYQLGDTINQISPTVNCEVVGGQLNAVDAYAVILTGEGIAAADPLLTITSAASADKVFSGAVYMARVPDKDSSLSFGASLEISGGDLVYTNTACPGAVDLPTAPKALTFFPLGYGPRCVTEDWSTLFLGKKPPEPVAADFSLAPAPSEDEYGCMVWEPGRYSSPPALANNSFNFFKSGDYYFDFPDSDASWNISEFVLIGGPGTAGPGIPGRDPDDPWPDNNCNVAASASRDDQTGAAVYLGGESNITIGANGSLEVTGRDHSGYNVAIQALEATGVASTRVGGETIVATGSGSNKQLAIRGFVWAPEGALLFDQISNTAVAALTGGAVLAGLSAGASASANNFLITVDTQPTEAQLLITTTAVNSGTTSVRSRIIYRTDTTYALQSRRVMALTPE